MDDGQLSQDDIDALLSGGDVSEGGDAGGDAGSAPEEAVETGLTDQAGIDELIAQISQGGDETDAEGEVQVQTATAVADPVAGEPFHLPEVNPAVGLNMSAAQTQINLLKDVSVKVRVELGRGKMYFKDILRLTNGSVVELNKLAGDPLDIYVNERLIAKGEVLVLNENFCIRITEIFSPEEVLRLKG